MDTKKAVQIAIGLGVLFATVWVVGKAWKKSQNFSGATGRLDKKDGGVTQDGCPCYENGQLTGYSRRCCTTQTR